MANTDFIKQQKFLFWIIGIGLVILLLANALGWIYLQRIKSFFISDLKFRLENITNLSTELIDATDIAYLFPGDKSDPQYVYYQNRLFQIKEDNNLQDIYILSPTLETVVDLIPDFHSELSQRTPDQDLVERAMSGETVTGELMSLGDQKFLTAIAPLLDSNNMITGLLVVEVPADFFEMLDQFDRGLLIFSFLNAFLILSVAFFLVRSIKRVFLLQNLVKNQEHLVRLGEMAASVAHEIRNPLGIIKGANSLIQKKYGSEKEEVFSYIPAELERLNKLIEDFLSFAHSRDLKIQPVKFGELLTKLKIGFSEYKNVKFILEISENNPVLNTDGDALEQILLNIIKNSIQACSQEGEIIIKYEPVLRGMVHIQISDNGPGIPAEILDRIFDPFFTTREEGSGLGLAISKRLIEQLEGDIFVKSTLKRGTTLTLSLPNKKHVQK
jgi:signal transduction histidine kinase